ncbi:MAG: hypothetical protein V3V67_15045, partial [Myxococcota bacterium]
MKLRDLVRFKWQALRGETPRAKPDARNGPRRGHTKIEAAGRKSAGRSSQMARMKRGVGYCENTDCEDYAKGVFLL